jgi:heme exporter protein B
MNSPWGPEIRAILRKEWRSELRHRAGFLTSLFLSLITVFTLTFAFYGRQLSGEGAAGLLWASLLFASVSVVSRAFVAEEEQGTGDLLRLWARPHAVFWGKCLYACLQMGITALFSALFFLLLSGVTVQAPALLLASIVAGTFALAGTVTFCSALIGRGSARGSLAGVVSLPLLLPLIALGVTAGRAAFGVGTEATGWSATGGIALYAALTLAVTPHLFAALWREP